MLLGLLALYLAAGAIAASRWIPYDEWRFSVRWIPATSRVSYVVGNALMFAVVAVLWPLYGIVRRRVTRERRAAAVAASLEEARARGRQVARELLEERGAGPPEGPVAA